MAEINTEAFADAVVDKLEQRELSYRAAVDKWPELNVAMLSRACSQQNVSAGNLLIICRYLGLDPFVFLVTRKRRRVTMKSIVKQSVTVSVSREKRGRND